MSKSRKYLLIAMILSLCLSGSHISIADASSSKSVTTENVNVENNDAEVNKAEENASSDIQESSFVIKNFKPREYDHILIDYKSSLTMSALNENNRIPMGRMVTMMTSLLMLESHNSDDVITARDAFKAPAGNSIGVNSLEEFKLIDLIYAINFTSSNDAIKVLVESDGGSDISFTEKMNTRAKELGMTNTNFVSPYLNTAPNQYTSLKDISILFRELIKYKDYYDVMSSKSHVIPVTNKKTSPRERMLNPNLLLQVDAGKYKEGEDEYSFYDKDVKGIKVSTLKEGTSICASFKIVNDKELIAINYSPSGSIQCYADNKHLLYNGEANLHIVNVVDKGEVVDTIKVTEGEEEKVVNVISSKRITLVLKADETVQTAVNKTVQIMNRDAESIKKRSKVGIMRLSKNGQEIAVVDLYPQLSIMENTFIGEAEIEENRELTTWEKFVWWFWLLFKIGLILFIWFRLLERNRKELRKQFRARENKRQSVVDFGMHKDLMRK